MNVYDLLMAHSTATYIKDWELWAVEVVVDNPVVFADGVKQVGFYPRKWAGYMRGELYEISTPECVDVLAPIWQATTCTIVGADSTGIVVIPKGSTLELILPLETLVWPLPL